MGKKRKGPFSQNNDRKRYLQESMRGSRHEGSYASKTLPDGEVDDGEKSGPKRRVALLLGYCGTGYQGMQINPGVNSIEAELERALYEAGFISKLNFGDIRKISWSRAARTDKGVHAACQVVTCKVQLPRPKAQPETGSEKADNPSDTVSVAGEAEATLAQTTELPSPPVDGAADEAHLAEVGAVGDDDGGKPEKVDSGGAKDSAGCVGDAVQTENGAESAKADEARLFSIAHQMINQHLPAGIRVHEVVKVTKSFHAKNLCTKRRYCYLLPTFVLEDVSVVTPMLDKCQGKMGGQPPKSPAVQRHEGGSGSDGGVKGTVEGETGLEGEGEAAAEEEEEEDDASRLRLKPWYPWPDYKALAEVFRQLRGYRLPREKVEKFRRVVELYKGTHKFHNYSVRLSWKNKQASRYIHSIEASEPFVRDGMEWMGVTLVGQSFLLHQIRKMVAVVIEVVRGGAPESVVTEAFKDVMMTLPMAPSDGLFLDKAYFDVYDSKWSGERGTLDWEERSEELRLNIQKFKEEHVQGHIVSKEPHRLAFINWLYHVKHRYNDPEDTYKPREMSVGEKKSEVVRKEKRWKKGHFKKDEGDGDDNKEDVSDGVEE